ncbi:MAG: class I SAM-dependent RNA methyltransferase, partial [Pyrinomonadaceae bacterium]
MNNRHKIGEILEVTIEKIVPNGFGLAFAENLTVFVSLAAKGDKLLVKIYEKKGKIAFAEIVEIIEPSKDRTEPECPYFGICGGCNFQHLNYAAQLEAKVDIVKDCLARIGKINYEKEIQIIGSPKDYGYRARAQWHLDTRHKKFGYFQRNSHRVIDAKICPILTPELGKTLTDLRTSVAWESFWSEMVEIETATDGREVSVYSAETVETTKELCFEAKGEQYFYDATSFFQGNLFLIEKLIETATKDASGETAIDLYCGVGLFTLPLARKFKKVFAVEGNAKAIEFAKKNVEKAQLGNIKFFTETVGDFLIEKQSDLQNLDFVLLDPP